MNTLTGMTTTLNTHTNTHAYFYFPNIKMGQTAELVTGFYKWWRANSVWGSSAHQWWRSTSNECPEFISHRAQMASGCLSQVQVHVQKRQRETWWSQTEQTLLRHNHCSSSTGISQRPWDRDERWILHWIWYDLSLLDIAWYFSKSNWRICVMFFVLK